MQSFARGLPHAEGVSTSTRGMGERADDARTWYCLGASATEPRLTR